MNKIILALYLFGLFGLITSKCDCCSECGLEEETTKQEEVVERLSGSCPDIKYINGGLSGSGFASRYWDCCKPSCAWTGNAGAGNEARECDANMNILTNKNSKNICENGGISTTCLSQIPFTIDGCDELGFAFAAVPGGGPSICGRCFALEFTGEGKYEIRTPQKKLKGKKLIVMASNIGYDVASSQFDIMIPGGGVGNYNGCDNILGTNLGQQYGGLLADCESSVGYSYSEDIIYEKRKECLTNKCNTVFANKATAREGCLFLANFLESAGNPLHNFKEVECPQVLRDRY